MPPRPPVRVCHVIHDLRPGGAEHLLVDLAGVARQHGIEMAVVAPMSLRPGGHASELRAAGVEVVSLQLKTRWDPRGAARLRRELTRLQPDVVHAHLKHADLLAARSAPQLGIPFVSTLHVIEDQVGGLSRLKRRVATRARLRHAALTLTVSDAVRDWYLSMSGAAPCTVATLHNGVADLPIFDEHHRAAVRAEWGATPEVVVAVTIAVLRPGKGIGDLLEAAAALPAGSPLRFVVAGSGPEEPVLLRQARELGVLGDRVLFVGFVGDVAELLDGADLLVHPSHRDALPTAVLRGMAAGLPVVASDVGGTPEIVTDEVGLLVPPGDPVGLRSTLEALVADPDGMRWMGKRARERYESEFSLDRWAERLRSLYDRVLGRPGPGI